MATLSLNLLQMSVSLAREEPEYTDIAERFLYDFVQLATTLNTEAVIDSKARVLRSYKNWDDQDGFYYDVIKRPDGSWEYLRSRSIAGLIPLLAVASFSVETVEKLPVLNVREDLKWLTSERVHPTWLSSISAFGATTAPCLPPYRRRTCAAFMNTSLMKRNSSPHRFARSRSTTRRTPTASVKVKPQQRSPTASR